MKKNNYTVIIVRGAATSDSRTFTISHKLVKNSLIAIILLLVMFGFLMFDYLTISFNKEKMKRLQNRIIYLEKEKKLYKQNKSGRKYISEYRELRNLQKKLESIKDEIKKREPLLDLTNKQVQIVANETRKEIDKSYMEKLPWQIIIGFFVSFIAGLGSGVLILERKKLINLFKRIEEKEK